MNIIKKNPKRLNLRGWSKLEGIQKQLTQLGKQGGYEPMGELILEFLNLCDVKVSDKTPWYETVDLFVQAQVANAPKKPFPLLKSKSKGEDAPWDYAGRDWYWWLNLFASHYGWGEAEVEVLDIDDAIGLYEEILVDDQMDKEWEHSHYEGAYEYIPATKKSRLVPLPRPDWMLPPPNQRKVIKTKIRKDMMPVGNVVNLDED
jgi:hypothetical protein